MKSITKVQLQNSPARKSKYTDANHVMALYSWFIQSVVNNEAWKISRQANFEIGQLHREGDCLAFAIRVNRIELTAKFQKELFSLILNLSGCHAEIVMDGYKYNWPNPATGTLKIHPQSEKIDPGFVNRYIESTRHIFGNNLKEFISSYFTT